MTEITVPQSEIRAHVRAVDDAAHLMDEIDWPTMDFGALIGSAVSRTVESSELPTALDGVVADLRSWTEKVRAAVAACEQSDCSAASALA